MTLLYADQFLRKYAARTGRSLTETKMFNLADLTMPKETVLHYMPMTTLDRGFRGNSLFVANWPNNIRLHHVTEPVLSNGKPRKQNYNAGRFVTEYFREQKGIKRSRDINRDLQDQRDMLVMDYTLIPRMSLYPSNKFTLEHMWLNMFETMAKSSNFIGDARPQFIQIQMPRAWMTTANFRMDLDSISDGHRDRYNDPALFWILEVFRLLDGAESVLAKLQAEDFILVFSVGSESVMFPMNTLIDAADADSKAANKFHAVLEKLIQMRTTPDTAELDKVETPAEEKDEEQKKLEKLMPEGMRDQLSMLIENGQMTQAEQKRFAYAIGDMAKMDSPFDEGKTLIESAEVSKEDIKLNNDLKSAVNPNTLPADALKCTTVNFKKDYIKTLMEKDIANMFISLNRSGVVLRKYEIDTTVDALEEMKTYTVDLLPVIGTASTVKFQMPVFEEDGSFSMGGIRYSIDAQKVDMPIRKTKSNQAALTSYAGKIFVNRSELAKHSSGIWLRKQIKLASRNAKDNRVTDLNYGTQKVPNVKLPLHYSSLMPEFTRIAGNGYDFILDYVHRKEILGEDKVKAIEKNGVVAVGTYRGGVIGMDMNNRIVSTGKDHGTILDALGGGFGKPPRDVAIIKSLNRKMPVAFIIGYLLGLDKMIKRTKAKVRYEATDRRAETRMNEVMIPFADERIYVTVDKPEEALLWSGLEDMSDMTRRFNISDFNRKAGWLACLPYYKANKGHTDTWTLWNDLFLDPITIEVLTEMKEPTNLIDLLLRCVDLIKTDDAPDEADPKFMRVRGMERISGLIYMLMYDAIKQQRRSANPKNEKVSIPPTALLEALQKDTSVQLVQEINVIHNLKEQEAVTLAGEGGRSARTLVKRNRVFHENDLGILSEHTPDSAKVGIRGFMTPNAQLESLRGTSGSWSPEDGSTALLSTTALLLPDMDRDDG